MQYDPKLKKAMSEIKDILDKYDIAGFIALHSVGHGEHMFKINPSYSCAFVESTPQGDMVRVRARVDEDYDGDVKKCIKAQSDTVNMFEIMTDMIGANALHCISISEMLHSKLDIDNTKGGHTSHQTQNN